MATVTESATKAVRQFAEPLQAAVEENVRELRHAIVAGRHTVEDVAAEATTYVRRHPFVSLGISVRIGTLVGCLIGFTVGRFGRSRSSK